MSAALLKAAFLCMLLWIWFRIMVMSSVSYFCKEKLNSPLNPHTGAKVGKKKKVKGGTKASKSNGTCWANIPLPPPPMHPLPGTEVDLDRYPQENPGGG